MRCRCSLIFSLFFGLAMHGYAQQPIQQLNANWLFRNADEGDRWFPAIVPGTIHTDLLANGLIPDPFSNCNNLSLAWIDSARWEYKTIFDLDSSFSPNDRLRITFLGLDTYALVFLNDSLIIRANNMFRVWSTECTGLLHRKGNRLRILFSPALLKADSIARTYGYTLPGGQWAYVRKAPYHFGWDWGPRLITCGIWKPVTIRKIPKFDIAFPAVVTHSIGDSSASLGLTFDYRVAESDSFRVMLRNCSDNRLLIDTVFFAGRGKNLFVKNFTLENPRLWWPNGMGEQHLYRFRLEVYSNGKSIAGKMLHSGIRTIRLVSRSDSIGRSFFFEVNGMPLFMKGANLIPPHSFLPAVTDSVWQAIVRNAVASNFNMLRVWGGGVYPPHSFMEACSENGILVWQDFVFACSLYPFDSLFTDNVRREAEQQVKRLRKYTALALWCGNNEVDEAWHNWGWKRCFEGAPLRADSVWNGYRLVFHKLLPGIVARFDATRSYWPSSPGYGWGDSRSMTHGDSHYWGVWWGMEPFSQYSEKVPRFMSEYGFQGAPSDRNIMLFGDGNCWPDSMQLNCHQKHPTGYQTINTYLKREGLNPKNPEQWAYYSRILQAYGYRQAIDAHRLAAPYCMGTLYWQLNDCWPVVSWSGIDFLGQWKAVQYTVRNHYRPVIAVPFISESEITVRAVSDIPDDTLSANLRVTVMAMQGDTLAFWENKVSLIRNIARSVGNFSYVHDTGSFHPFFVHSSLTTSDGDEFQTVVFSQKLGEIKTGNPDFKVQIEGSQNRGTIVLSVHAPAFFVELSTNRSGCYFEDNYLHLFPCRTYRIEYRGKLGDTLTLKWLGYDCPVTIKYRIPISLKYTEMVFIDVFFYDIYNVNLSLLLR